MSVIYLINLIQGEVLMSLLREMGDSLIKYGEIIIDKTEQFTRTARTRIEIRKKESEINNIKIQIADHVIARMQQKEQVDNEFVIPRINSINNLSKDITGLQTRLEELKRQSDNSGESSGNETSAGTAS